VAGGCIRDVRGAGGFCKRCAWGTCVIAGAFVNDIEFHADRASRTVELVVKTASLQREYELCMTECKRRVRTHCRPSCPCRLSSNKGIAECPRTAAQCGATEGNSIDGISER
jgi:hypothetical protein